MQFGHFGRHSLQHMQHALQCGCSALVRAAMSSGNVLYRDAIAEHNTDRCYVSKSPGMEQFPDVKPHAVVSASALHANLRVLGMSVHMCEFGTFAGKRSVRPA